jgi:nitroreductase
MNASALSDELRAILDLARWAPSGDNTQPWRFEVVDDRHFVIHGHDTRDWCVYDLDGHASQIALGALLETVAIAASTQRLRATFERRSGCPETNPLVDVNLEPDQGLAPDPLAETIMRRVTQRRPFATQPLSAEQKQALEGSVGDGFEVYWLESTAERWRMAKLLFRSAHIRLTIPEAYEVHRNVIEWRARTSVDRIPDQAVGLDPVGVALMRWGMKSWRRVDFLNRWFAGTWLPRLQLDLLPGYRCAAHALIVSRKPLDGVDAYLAAGRVVQRFWLTATIQELQFQPEMTPLIFARYSSEGRAFCALEPAAYEARTVRMLLERQLSAQAVRDGVFLCRLGIGSRPVSRSTRLSLERLLQWGES